MNEKNYPLVSVIIPCYNSESFITETINSVLNQTYKNLEIIVVDDSSTDLSYNIASELAKSNNNIFCYQIERAGYPSIPRNFGAKKANGSFLAFIDSDDIWYETKLTEQLKILMSNPGIDLVYTASITFGDVNIFSKRFEILPLFHKAAHNHSDLVSIGNSISCSSVVLRKEAFDAQNGFDESDNLKFVEDYDLWLRISKNSQIYFLPKILTKYRVHTSQNSSDIKTKQIRLENLAHIRNITLPKYKFRAENSELLNLVKIFANVFTFIYFKTISLFEK